MIRTLEGFTSILLAADRLRTPPADRPRLGPEAFDTEESVWESLLRHGENPIEVAREQSMVLRALRIMLDVRLTNRGK